MLTRLKRSELQSAVSAAIDAQRGQSKPALVRKQRKRKPRAAVLIAYDFETTRIEEGTPRPLYLTAYGDNFSFASPISNMASLRAMLRAYFLTPENYGVKFVAWNGNNFDAYFVAAALLSDSEFIIRPYMTRSKAIRGVRISLAADGDSRTGRSWEFLDGIAMLGLAGTSLDAFLKVFAPDHQKLTGVIDFEGGEEFDSNNPRHCDYAMRDSVGLYHGMIRAQQIMLQNFDEPLAVTMGGVCIKVFQAHIPRAATIQPMDSTTERIMRRFVVRGGYCYCARQYDGPIWKYDINQAYAAAMRDAALPCGELLYSKRGLHPSARVYMARLTAYKTDNIIPFYYRTEIEGRIRSVFGVNHIHDTWLTSIEVEQLRAEGWTIEITESHQWSESFNMREYVDKLERVRMTCEGGPKGAIGTMTKATGNHSFGKTLEQTEPLEFLVSADCPSGYVPYYGDEAEPLEHVFCRIVDDQRQKAYHKPQIGAFITAHCRMVLRRAALLNPHAWLYADTDCVVFSESVTDRLDIDPGRYGAWKLEEDGARYQIIAKKVYSEVTDSPKADRKAKGLNVKRLTGEDFARWYDGTPPVQEQVQKQNFLAVMRGAEMFRKQTRHGTDAKRIRDAQKVG